MVVTSHACERVSSITRHGFVDTVRMRFAWLFAIAACGDNARPSPGVVVDASPDAPPDPFVGMFTSPADFPHTNCTPGSLAGFAYAGYYPAVVGLRTAF